MTTDGYVVVDFASNLLPLVGLGGLAGPRSSAPNRFQCFSTLQEAMACMANMQEKYPAVEIHPWPLPASAILRLQKLHPAEDWSWMMPAEYVVIREKMLRRGDETMTTTKKPEGWVIVDMLGYTVPFKGPHQWFSPASLELATFYPSHKEAGEALTSWTSNPRYEVHPWPLPRAVLDKIRGGGAYAPHEWDDVPVAEDATPDPDPTPCTKGKTVAALQGVYKALQVLADAAGDDAFPFEKGAPKTLTPDEAQHVVRLANEAKNLMHQVGGLVSYVASKGVSHE